MFLLTYCSIPFSAVNFHFFLTFSCVCQICVLRYWLYIFCNYYHLSLLSPYEYQSEVNFWGDQLQIQLQILIWVVTFWPEFRVHSGSGPICFTLAHCGGSTLDLWVVLFDLNLGSTLALVSSMSHLNSLWWRLGGPLCLQLWSHLSHLSWLWGVYSIKGGMGWCICVWV